jgi:hypothetical protein
VVNGAVAVLGSDRDAIEKAITETRKNAQTLSLPVKLRIQDDKIIADLPDAKGAARNAEVWLCPVTGKITVNISRGENNGKTLTYYNVVRDWKKLGDWAGKAESFSVPLSDLPNKDIDSFALLVQSGAAAKPGAMLGAAIVPAKASTQ